MWRIPYLTLVHWIGNLIASAAMKLVSHVVLCVVAFCLTALGQTPNQVPQLEPLPCEGVKWEESGELTSVDFENGTDGPLTIERLFPFREEPGIFRTAQMRVLPPGYAVRMTMREGVPHRMIDESGKCLARFRAAAEPARARVGEKRIHAPLGIPPFRLRVTFQAGNSIEPDDKGVYLDGSGGVSATACDALSLWLGASKAEDPCAGPSERGQTNVRTISVDLGNPVEGSGAKKLERLTGSQARIHVFLSRDRERRMIHSIYEVNAGETVQSDRVEIGLRLGGEDHVLLVGPWGPGEFNLRQPTVLHGEGSSKATVKRISNTMWVVDAPPGSIGRLWNNADPANPVDRGLYYASFGMTFELLTD